MRPTSLGFRSPKEKSGEFTLPTTHYLGKSLNLVSLPASNREFSKEENKRFTTFTAQDRFFYQKVSHPISSKSFYPIVTG
jgi:hypothetical protein